MRSFAALSAACLSFLAVSAAGAEMAERYSFRHYGDEHGLGNLAVTVLAQDRVGFLWVGTQDGLYRFDGSEFVRFGREDGLPSTFIQALHVDSAGSLWIGTGAGVARRQGDGFRAYGPADGVPIEKVPWHGLASDASGTLYIATAGGVRVLRGGRFEDLGLGEAWPGPVTALEVAPDGALWLAGAGHVGRAALGTVETWGPEAGVPGEQIHDLLIDASGEVFARSAGQLVSRPPGGRGFIDRGRGLPPANYFGTLYQDPGGDLWALSDFGLARRRADGTWDVMDHTRGLSSDNVVAMLVDREGLIWVGLYGAGLDCWLGYPSWTAVTTAEGLSNNTVWSITRAADGALWVGTDSGLNRLDPRTGRWRALLPKDGLAGLCAYALRRGRGADLWVSFLPGGLSRIDTVTLRVESYGPHDGLVGERTYAVAPAPDGGVWAGTSAGLYYAKPGAERLRFVRVAVPEGDDHETFGVIFLDARGRVWAGGERGLCLLEGGSWRRLTKGDGLKDDYVFYIAEEPSGALWLAYWEALGASRLELGGGSVKWRHLDVRSGLASDSVEFLGVDRRGRLWLGTSHGVNVVDGDRVERFSRADGLVWNSCDAFYEDPDGGFWIGTTRGLSRFRPHPRREPAPPTVALLETRLGDLVFPVDRPAEVDYSGRTFEVSYAGLTFPKAEQTRFRYRLVGFEETPTETAHRAVRYAKLPPGSFSFEVEARNAEGVWSPAPARFDFRILPPWYLTWWALVLGAGLALGVGGLTYRRRVAHLVEARQRLEAAVEQRTLELSREKKTVEEQARALLVAAEERRNFYAMVVHDLKNPLTPILAGLELIERDLPATGGGRRSFGLVKQAASRMLFLVERFTSVLRTSTPDGRGFGAWDLVSDLALSYASAARRRGLTLIVAGRRVDEDWTPPRGGPIAAAPTEVVYLAMENILGNALKYAAVEIRLSASEAEAEIVLAVENDGPTIPDADKQRIFGLFQQLEGAKPGTGVGLASARQMIEGIGGRILLRDVAPSGARFEVCLPRSVPRP